MTPPDGMETLTYRDLARLAAAGLRVPEFLVLAEAPEGTCRWLDAGLVPVAEHWLRTSCGEALLPEAVGLVSQIAVAMDRVLDCFLEMHTAAASAQQRRWTAWQLQRQVVLSWLAQTGAQEVNAAAQAWLQRADDNRVTWQAWEQIHTLPELSRLRASLVQHMTEPSRVDYDLAERICGMRATGT
jgi:hypothetical protein